MPLIDIHCHIMPGVDDGARDEEMSLQMLRMAAAEGIEHIILTPHHKPEHHNPSARTIVDLARALQARCDEEGIKVALHTGTELYYYSEAAPLIEAGQIATLAGSDFLLVEFHPSDPYPRIRNAVIELFGLGVTPVIAHVERYRDVVEHAQYIRELSEMGCGIQVNALTLTGHYGRGLRSFAKKLCKEGLVDFVATDAHNLTGRAPRLREAYRYVASRCGQTYAQRIFYENALHVIRHEPLS